MKIYLGDFSFWRFVHVDLSFEDLLRRFFLLKFRIWDLSLEDLFMEICSRDFSFEDLFRRFFLLKFYFGDFSFLRFVQERRFIWRIVQERRFILWRFVQEIYHFEDFFRRFFLLKFFLGDLSFWKFV